MKKSALALAVLGATAGAAVAQSNVTIYGVADSGISYRDSGAAGDSKTWRLESGQQSGSRLGFKGSEDLGGGLSAIFVLENGFSIDTGTTGQGGRLFGRQAFVGLNGGFGAIKVGRQYIPLRLALGDVDPFEHGLAGNISNVFLNYGERSDNTVNYSLPSMGGLYGQIAYGFGEVAGDTSAGRQLGVSAGYKNGPFNIVVAHQDQDLGNADTPNNGDANTTFLGGTFDFGFAKAHAAFAVNKGDAASGATNVDSRDTMLGVSAPVGPGAILASYIRRDEKLVANADSDQWAIGYTHPVSKRTNLYTSYARVKNDGAARLGGAAAAGDDPSTFNIGIRHKF